MTDASFQSILKFVFNHSRTFRQRFKWKLERNARWQDNMIKKRMIKGTPSFKPDFLTFRSIQQNSITCSYTGFQPVSGQNFRNIACSIISDYPSRIHEILTLSFCMLSYANANVKVQNRTWHRDAGDLKLVKIFGCWCSTIM